LSKPGSGREELIFPFGCSTGNCPVADGGFREGGGTFKGGSERASLQDLQEEALRGLGGLPNETLIYSHRSENW